MYLPLAAIVVLAVVGVEAGLRRLAGANSTTRAVVGALATVIAVVALAAETRARNRDYWSEERLWRDTVAKQPGNQRGRVAYGSALAAAGRLEEAESEFRQATKLEDGDAIAHARLGMVLAARNREDDAIVELERALALRPDDVDAHRMLAQIYGSRRDDRNAVTHLERAIRVAGDDPALLTSLAAIFADSRDVGVRDARRALALAEKAAALTRRQDPYALDVLAVAQAAMARYADAAATAREGAAIARARGQQALLAELESRANAYAALAR
jgi:cytochrome c-type biogenesis protein CcmH/NrfG